MAIFNPSVAPTQDPNYLNYSRVLDAPAPNMSGKIALETAATGLDSAVTITDQAIKKGIDTEVYNSVDPLRDQMTSALERVKGDLDKGIIPKPVQGVASASTGKSWLDANAMAEDPENLPVGLQEGLDGVTAMANARAAGSPKLNDTKYAGDVLAEAKRLRNQYGPGYREYIDQKISQASGLPVANSYYNNMLLDINRQMSQIGKVKDDIGNTMMKNLDVPGMAGYIAKRKQGDPAMTDAFILEKVADWQNIQTQQKIDAATRAAQGDDKKLNADNQTARMTRTLNSSVQMEMSALKDVSLPGGGTAKDLLTYFDDVASGRITQSDTEVGQKKMMFNNWVKNVETRLLAQASGYAETVGGGVAEKAVQTAMAPIYAQQKFINSKEDGPAFFHAQQVEAIKKDAVHNFLLNKDTSATSRQLLGAREVLGEQYFPDWLKGMIATGVDLKYKDMFNEEAMNAIQPITDSRGQPIPRYMKDAIQHGKAVGATGESNYFGSITELASKIGDPQMNLKAKDQLIDWAFNSKNVGRLDELKMDYRDPQTGRMVDGKYRMFNILSSPGIVQGVKSTALVKPENYQKFQRTLEVEFGRLYRSTMQDLNKIVAEEGRTSGQGTVSLDIPVEKSGKSSLAFSFNDKTNAFGIVDKNNVPITRENLTIRNPKYSLYSGMLDRLDLVNSGVANMANVHRNNPQGPGDTPQYLLQLLQTTGFRPGSNITGATEGMAKALIKSKNPEMTPQQLDKQLLGSNPTARSNFAPEGRRGDLASFLSNPTGDALPKRISGQVVGPNETITSIKNDEIPAGMGVKEFIQLLKREGRY